MNVKITDRCLARSRFTLSTQIRLTHLEFCTASKPTIAQPRYDTLFMTTPSTRHMHTTSIDSNEQDGDGLPEALDAHGMKNERETKAASKMSNTQNTPDHVPRSAYDLESPLNTQNPVHAALDIVSIKLYPNCSGSITNTLPDRAPRTNPLPPLPQRPNPLPLRLQTLAHLHPQLPPPPTHLIPSSQPHARVHQTRSIPKRKQADIRPSPLASERQFRHRRATPCDPATDGFS
jgi:hypothetical protein